MKKVKRWKLIQMMAIEDMTKAFMKYECKTCPFTWDKMCHKCSIKKSIESWLNDEIPVNAYDGKPKSVHKLIGDEDNV